MVYYIKINRLLEDCMSKEHTIEKKKSSWLQITLIGLVAFLFGILTIFFKSTASAIIFITIGIMLLIVGITDAAAALKYKDDDDDWKTPMIVGVSSVLISLLFVITYWLRISISGKAMLIIIGSWGILRCLVLLIGIIRGRVKRKGSITSAMITGVGGILVILGNSFILSASKLIGYVLVGIGIILTFIGLYQRADKREKKEKEERDKLAQKKAAKLEVQVKNEELPELTKETQATSAQTEENKDTKK